MKKILLAATALAAVLIVVVLACSGGSKSEGSDGEDSTTVAANKPLNITIYLDLSDRLTRDLTPSQMERDTAIISYLADNFINNCVQNGILQSKNSMRVIFYPTPNSSEIVAKANDLDVDLASLQGAAKKKSLVSMKEKFSSTLSDIYDETLKAKNWIGSDVWGFFSDKKVDVQCMKKDYRNILVILTDGFLFDVNNKQKQGDAYSYILPQTLAVPNSSLICKRDGLQDLEVLMLEVNPYDQTKKDQQIQILDDWFKAMGVGNFVVAETDIPSNTKKVIDHFLN